MSVRRRGDRGVGALEFLLVAPFVFLALLGVIQVALVTVANGTVEDAARAAAHAGRNSEDPSTAARRAAGKAVQSVSVTKTGNPNTWEVAGKVVTVFPGANVTVRKSAEMP